MTIIGYHTLEDRGNPKEILESGPKPCLRADAKFETFLFKRQPSF